MSFLENFKNMFGKKKSLDYRKIELRASLKDLMKMRGLRSINFANYHRWKNDNDNGNNESPWLHSLKLNLMDGYLYMYEYRNGTDPRAGQKIEDATVEMYGEAYNIVKRILADEANIPSKIKRNILVKMAR